MDTVGLIGTISIVSAALCIAIGGIGPAIGEGMVAAAAMRALAQQPDEAGTITRTLFVAMAMVESTAIYAFVVTMIILFANPFWNYAIQHAAGN